ncbi:MAG: methionine--tRNA ligase [Oscillospiraceae bacterium]
MNKKTFYIATAIAYASKMPHIGNTYEVVMADAIARYKRSMGFDVYYLTGTDEHGEKIEQIAKENKMDPKDYVDKIAGDIKDLFDYLNISYDQFIRTTDENHKKVVQDIFKKLYDNGDIYKGDYEGLYCVPCESFFTDTQLKDGCCPDCGRDVKKTKEEAYFFKISKYTDKLSDYIENNDDFIVPISRKREMVNSFLKEGLQDLCVSRTSFKWGVPVSFDENHVVYVWIDALSNYITALGYSPNGENGQLYNKYWPCDLHLIGKDILRFHTIYWPIMLMALGEELPKQILGHPWLLSGEDKMSKSKGNVIYARDLAKHFSVDAVRHYLLSEIPYANDGKITYETFITKYNADLANNLGNLANRTITMANKYFAGKIFEPNELLSVDKDLIDVVLSNKKEYISSMDDYKMSDAVNCVISIGKRANKYIDETMPWVLGKEGGDKERLKTVIYCLLESIRFIAVLLKPLMPDISSNILAQINTDNCDISELNVFDLKHFGHNVNEAKPLFMRIDEGAKLEEIKKDLYNDESLEVNVDEVKPLISIDKFFETKMVVAEILTCEDIKKSDKLYKFNLDDGSKNKRQIVSGVKKYYTKEELLGKKVIIVQNLKQIKLCGEKSEGMILSAEKDEKVNLIFVNNMIENGSEIC